MIDTCNPEIATWSSDGLTFVVKDTDKLFHAYQKIGYDFGLSDVKNGQAKEVDIGKY